ncbi:MAG: hypothetical protein HY294_05105 [Candidatus Rokubacteria bacterium]|nr:hypothetical protein [Candidatus Rokubacteria bacterium]MBI3825356.1 hypothetical protein [Candidatus Rokubacteria bacterium]
MKKTLAVLALTLAFSASVAFASGCPVQIKKGREAAAKMDQMDAKVKAALAKLDEAQKLHDSGKHADSLKTAIEANQSIGVK